MAKSKPKTIPATKSKSKFSRQKPYRVKVSATGKQKREVGPTDGRSDPLLVRNLLKALEQGLGRKHSAIMANISKQTLYRWLSEADEADAEGRTGTPAQVFRDLVREAETVAVKRNLLLIQAAGGKDWRAAAWYLERTQPEDYGPRERIDHRHAGDDGGPIKTMNLEVTPDALADEQIDKALEKFYAAKLKRRTA